MSLHCFESSKFHPIKLSYTHVTIQISGINPNNLDPESLQPSLGSDGFTPGRMRVWTAHVGMDWLSGLSHSSSQAPRRSADCGCRIREDLTGYARKIRIFPHRH